ncbi:MAG: hypothetical protein ACXAB4_03040 [Candidatus Hodarchaeales archaeon]|jgi:hypothetical protein
MPYRLRWLPQNPKSDIFHEWAEYSHPMSLSEAGDLLKQWRNPQNRIQGQIETFLEVVEDNRFALEALKARLEHGNLTGGGQGALEEEMLTREIIDESATEILNKIKSGNLHDNESVKNLVKSLAEKERAAHSSSENPPTHGIPSVRGDSDAINELESLGKIPSKAGGEKSFLSQQEIIPFLGTVLSHQIARQLEKFYPTDGHSPGKFGKINRLKTYQTAVARKGEIPPENFIESDMRVYPKEENSQILLITDFSTSMRDSLPSTKLSKLDGALLSVLGLFFYFRQQNLLARRKKFETALFPITTDLAKTMKKFYRLSSRQDMEDLLKNAKAQGYTPITDTVLDAADWVRTTRIRNREMHLVIITDGKANVSSPRAANLKPPPTLPRTLCDSAWRELSSVLWELKNHTKPTWGITYIQIGTENELSMLEKHVRAYLDRITKPILLRSEDIGTLGKRIASEVQRFA